VAAFFGMIAFVDDAVRLATTFAEDWPAGLRGATRFLVAVGVMAGWIMLSILAFVALTLLVGQPFYEAISKQVEDQLGGVPNEVNVSFWRSLPRTLAGSARSIAISVLVAIVTFGVGLVPVAGQIAAPVLGATLGGWLLTLELSGIAFERRGMYFRQRRQVLRARRPMALGFGVATFVCFLIPLGAVLIMPAAVAGATLLSRRVLGLPDVATPATPSRP